MNKLTLKVLFFIFLQLFLYLFYFVLLYEHKKNIGKGAQEGGDIGMGYRYGWFMLMCVRNQNNIL